MIGAVESDMDIRHLRYFVGIADCGEGFGHAATVLHVSQPALSQAIHQLERELGLLLFQRAGGRARLTAAGAAVLDSARQVLKAVDGVSEMASLVAGAHRGSVSLATLPSLAISPLPELIAPFIRSHPGIKVTIIPAFSHAEVLRQVGSGLCELGIAFTALLPAVPNLRVHPVGSTGFILVTPPGSRPATDRTISAEQLNGTRFIVGQLGTQMRTLVEDLIAYGIDIQVAVEAGHREAILPLVRGGAGFAFLPDAWESYASGMGLGIFRLEPAQAVTTWVAARRDLAAPAARALLQAMLDSRSVQNSNTLSSSAKCTLPE